jgi:hypothetical protein
MTTAGGDAGGRRWLVHPPRFGVPGVLIACKRIGTHPDHFTLGLEPLIGV